MIEKKRPPLKREWLCAYWLNRAADQRRGAGKWPDLRSVCISGARDMIELARQTRQSKRVTVGLPR